MLYWVKLNQIVNANRVDNSKLQIKKKNVYKNEFIWIIFYGLFDKKLADFLVFLFFKKKEIVSPYIDYIH